MAAVPMKVSMPPAAVGADTVARAPSPVVITIGFVIAANVAYPDAAADPVNGAT
jgi:hypothetical protein